MAKLDGTIQFVALFTVLNEFEQIRWQALVPTKSLEHIKSGLRGIVKSLTDHGLELPRFAFTDNVRSDYSTAMECIPSLQSHTTTHPAIPASVIDPLTLPESVMVLPLTNYTAIANACATIIADAAATTAEGIVLGMKLEWNYSVKTDATSATSQHSLRRLSWLHIAGYDKVYLIRVRIQQLQGPRLC